MPLATTDKVDLVFRAIADRTRLRILSLLAAAEEICVCDLVRVLEVPQAKVSRHLAYLRKAGLVSGRKEQQWMHYRLIPAKSDFHQRMLDCLACCLSEVPELKADRKRLGKCCGRIGSLCC